LLYNACDVGVNTAMGEGWGLVSFEHAATGAAQIVPNHTSFIENWTGSAELLDVIGQRYINHEFAEMYEVSAEDLCGRLEKLYSDKVYRQQMSRLAFTVAAKPQYRWENIGQQLAAILEGSEVPDT
jgi:glycosyltransferase involved in cell wall biosynthesis